MNVNSVNETYQKALKAGAKSKREPSDEFMVIEEIVFQILPATTGLSLLIKKTSQEMNSKD